jgi:hypothetical protein
MADWSQNELARAGALLFGRSLPHPSASREVWQSEVRAAFRRRALDTHPDRASVLRRSEAELAAEFKAVYQAYRLLESLPCAPGRVASRREPPRPAPPPPRRAAPSRPPAPAPAPAPAQDAARTIREDHFFRGAIPQRPLRLGEFLYYTGRISFWAWVESISWQRQQRPAIGRIAMERGQLTAHQVFEVLQARRRDQAQREPFGTYALKLGLLTEAQLQGLLGRQRLLQERIGAYFTQRGLLATDELEAARRAMMRHNAQCRG